MVMTTTLQPVASFSWRAASRAFISSGFVMVAIEARSMVPSSFTATTPDVSGTCLTHTMHFIFVFPSVPYFTPMAPEMTIRWTSLVPS